MAVEKANGEDSKEVCDIYNYFVFKTIHSLDTEPWTPQKFEDKIKAVEERNLPFLVFRASKDNEISGYIYAENFNIRKAYNQTVRIFLYVKESRFRRGIGSELMKHCLEELKEKCIHKVVLVLALPNTAGVKFLEKFKFKQATHFEKALEKLGETWDFAFFQMQL